MHPMEEYLFPLKLSTLTLTPLLLENKHCIHHIGISWSLGANTSTPKATPT